MATTVTGDDKNARIAGFRDFVRDRFILSVRRAAFARAAGGPPLVSFVAEVIDRETRSVVHATEAQELELDARVMAGLWMEGQLAATE